MIYNQLMQNTSTVLMIRPLHFMFNAETAINNRFQVRSETENLAEKAVREFDAFVAALRKEGIDVTVVEDSPDPHTPDAIFPNNWISFHEDGVYCLYPMFAPNRRKERKSEVLELIQKRFGYHRLFDFTSYESDNRFLEGTGSMVLDRENRIAYACLSPRTDPGVLEDFCKKLNYRPVVFHCSRPGWRSHLPYQCDDVCGRPVGRNLPGFPTQRGRKKNSYRNNPFQQKGNHTDQHPADESICRQYAAIGK